jgi:hypothetical protein
VELVVFTVNVEEPEPPVTDGGVKLYVVFEGKPLTAKLTVPAYPPDGVTDTV